MSVQAVELDAQEMQVYQASLLAFLLFRATVVAISGCSVV
jgi:hypothetical protein